MRPMTPNALKVLQKRYLIKDIAGEVTETPEQLFRRVAHAVANAEKSDDAKKFWEDRFFELMSDLDFLPNTPTLINAGRPGGYGVYSACFVLPLEDHMSDIFETIKRTAVLHQTGAGTGYSLSKLRPKGATVSQKIGTASGPISFMKVFNAAVEEIKQGGTRRGAMLFAIHDSHPDVFEFATCKHDVTQMKNANISIAATDKFMEAVREDKMWTLEHSSGQGTRTIKARELWDVIIDSAWQTGDPGLLFVDTSNRSNPTPHVGEYSTTNPCGEQYLLPNESCNLGSINLINFIDSQTGTFDYARMSEVIHTSIRFLDDVIDVARYPFQEMTDMAQGNRKIGLGIMGWADSLILMGINYDSQQAIDLADKLGAFLQQEANVASTRLGSEKGSFPNFPGSMYDGKVSALRNSCRTTIAPTGTISLIANETSSGIEPVFAFNHTSNRMETQMTHSHPYAKKWADDFPGEPLPEYCIEAQEVSFEGHIKMQAAFQKYIDNSISKTINLPNSATREDIAQAYMMAYELGCKGITVFRDGCKVTGQVLETTKTAEILNKPKLNVEEVSKYYELMTGHGPLHVHINHQDGKACKVFLSLPPIGSELSAVAQVLGVTISKYLEQGGHLGDLIKHYTSVIGDSPVGLGKNRITSIPHALAKTFKEFLKGEEETTKEASTYQSVIHCPECYNSKVALQEGCTTCRECGWSKCS